MTHDLWNTIGKMQEMFTKYLEELKNKQTKMNNTLEGINSSVTEAEEQINDLEDRMMEITGREQNIEKRMRRNKDSLRDLCNNIKCSNIPIIGAPEGEDRNKGPGKISEEIITEEFPNMGKEIVNKAQEAHSSKQGKPKKEHTETHGNKIDKK